MPPLTSSAASTLHSPIPEVQYENYTKQLLAFVSGLAPLWKPSPPFITFPESLLLIPDPSFVSSDSPHSIHNPPDALYYKRDSAHICGKQAQQEGECTPKKESD